MFVPALSPPPREWCLVVVDDKTGLPSRFERVAADPLALYGTTSAASVATCRDDVTVVAVPLPVQVAAHQARPRTVAVMCPCHPLDCGAVERAEGLWQSTVLCTELGMLRSVTRDAVVAVAARVTRHNVRVELHVLPDRVTDAQVAELVRELSTLATHAEIDTFAVSTTN